MTIRDLRQYVRHICGEEALEELGTNKEPLLGYIYGHDPSPSQVKSIINDAASFASNAEEQLFYEFVQNAYDASADSLFFYADERYLIVLNNGKPFYTDFFNDPNYETIREGQLYSFLGKGRSLKRDDRNTLGEFGQGSKLLYTLLTRVANTKENKDLLTETLLNEKKGPYLISWDNPAQLANLLLKQPEWRPAQGDDYENNILFAKILMTYYPITPDVDEKLFSTQEAFDAIDAFNTLVDPRRNIHFLHRGTALIIPLGEGKYERINSEANLEKVRTRLGEFASITKSKGKSIEHIYVMGEKIARHDVKSVSVQCDVESKPFHYHFAFNPVFAEKKSVNLFKGLPILETKFGLGFIVDNLNFEVDSSRQRITDKDKTQEQLVRAFKGLVIELKEIKQNDPEKFNYIYKSLIATKIHDGEDIAYIRNAFKEVFKPFFEEFVLTSSGTYEKRENVKTYTYAQQIPLAEIGITKYQWISDDIKQHLINHDVSVEFVELAKILADSNTEKLQNWIKKLPTNEYIEFQRIIDKHKEEWNISSHKLFKTNKGNLYSYNELQSSANVYYSLEEKMDFGECEHLKHSLTNIPFNDYLRVLFYKIEKNIDEFKVSDSTKTDAANLLEWIVEKDRSYLPSIKREIKLLRNFHNEYVSFDNLFEGRPNGSILFDNYRVKGFVPEAVTRNNWLLSPTRQKKECWQWIVNHWNQLKENEDWGKNTHRYIADIKAMHNAAKTDPSYTDSTELTLYLNEDGKPTNYTRTVVVNASRLTEDEYNLLNTEIAHLDLLPYEYYKELTTPPFRVEKVKSVDIVSHGISVDKELLRILIKITDRYLDNYHTQENGDKYRIIKVWDSYNYTDEVSIDLQEELLYANFYRIPTHVQELLKVESGIYKFASNEIILTKAIEKIKTPIKLLPFVKNANINVINFFFNWLGPITVNEKITKEDLTWQTIMFAVNRSDNNRDYTKIVFNKLRHNNSKIPDSIIKQFITINNNEYDIYDLNEDYRNDNQTIDSFFNCLPSRNEVEYFKNNFYQNREEEILPESIYNDLHNSYLTIEQLRFCIDYSITNDAKYDNLEIEDELETRDALDMILENNFKGFDKYFTIRGVDYKQHIYAKAEILREDEHLPPDVQAWLNENQPALPLFTKLTTTKNPCVAIRSTLLNDEVSNDLSVFSNSDYKKYIDATISWAIEKEFEYKYEHGRYKTMMQIIEKLPSDYSIMPFLRYTGKVSSTEESNGKSRPLFTLERCQDNCAFLSISRGDQFESTLCKSSNLRKFIKEHTVYIYKDKEILFTHGYSGKPRWSIQTSVDIKKFPEYNDSVYERWKKMEESKGITIHTSENPITTSFNITSSNGIIFTDKMKDSEFGYEVDKCVVIQHPNKEELSPLKTIAKHIASINFFKEPFITLQSLYVDEWEQMKSEGSGKSIIDLKDSNLNEKQAQEALDKISSKTAENIEKINNLTEQMNSEDLDKLNEVATPIKKIIEGMEKEALEQLAKKKDKLIELLNESNEDEKESQIGKIIGFIGELIYGHYLENKEKKFTHDALKGVGEYDFKVESDNMYVDVKTNLKSLKDGTAPFYLHKSQNDFMKSQPDSKYHIVRISLTDLNLRNSYKELRSIYGKDADPMKDSNLRKVCEEIAKEYWETAEIEKFEALSPEYEIRREQKQTGS